MNIIRKNIEKKNAFKTRPKKGCGKLLQFITKNQIWRFGGTSFLEPLKGTPKTDVGLPWGTRGPIFLNCWTGLKAVLLQMSKTARQHYDTP